MAALAEDATETSVSRGENAEHVLHHVAVVRVLKEMGLDVADGRELSMTLSAGSGASKEGNKLRIVVFLVDRSTGRVEAVAERLVARD